MIKSEFFSWIFDEIFYAEFEIKPIEAATWILFFFLTVLAIINLKYLDDFIDFGAKMIVSAIIVAFFVKIKNPFS